MIEQKIRVFDKTTYRMFTYEDDVRVKNCWAIPKSMGGNIEDTDNNIYMLSTGQIDMNNNEIYKDDILEIIHTLDGKTEKIKAPVVYKNGIYGIVWNDVFIWLSNMEIGGKKIIGNIWEGELQ